MRELSKFWTEGDKKLVNEMIEKYYALNGKDLDLEKSAVLISELSSREQVYNVIKAIDDLCQEPKSYLRYVDIINKIKENKGKKNEVVEQVDCEHCMGIGHIALRDGIGYQFAVGCICEAGDNYVRATKSLRWNGKNEQECKGELMIKVKPLTT